MIRNKKNLLSVAIALALAGCGGGGGGGSSTPPPAASTTTGTAVDGYLAGMSMFCDTNNNGTADTGEANTLTNINGGFTFSQACSSTVVGTGGTSTDTGLQFNGQIKALPGSRYVTPLTSLMADGGLTAAQISTALGLAGSTDVSQIDPMSNQDLRKKTLAVQQIIQQVTNTLAALGQNNSPAALQAIYSAVAKSVVNTLKANPTTPLINANGNVSAALVSNAITGSITAVAASTNPILAVAQTNLNAFSATSIAELTSQAIVTQAQTLTQSSDASLVANVTSVQANPTISNAAVSLSSLLTTANASSVNLSTVGVGLAQLVDAIPGNDGDGAAEVIAAVGVEAGKVPGDAPAFDSGTWSAQSNVLAIIGDNIELNGQNYTLQNFATGTGVVLPARVSPLDTVRFAYQIKGTPIPANAQGVTTSRVSLGIELSDTTSSGRRLEFILDQADVSINAGQMSVSVPTGAQLYAYGRTANGTTANVTLTNVQSNGFLAVDNNELSFNAGVVLAKLAAPGSTFANLQNVNGTFNLKVVVSNLSIAGQTPTSVQGLSVNVTGGNQAITGLGVQGRFTVQ